MSQFLTSNSLQAAPALVVESLLYGAYTVLFGICIYVLCKRRQKSQFAILLTTAIVMFALSTFRIAIDFYETFNYTFDHTADNSADIAELIYVTNNVIADGLIVYRCYIVWGFNKYVIILPVLLVIATGACGFAFPLSIILTSLSLVTNVLVTALTAGRIWWISRRTKAMLGRTHSKKYNASLAIIVESGALYSISLLVLLVMMANFHGQIALLTASIPLATSGSAFNTVYAAIAQIVGIVPTLIIVRVGLNLSIQDVKTSTVAGSPPKLERADPPLRAPVTDISRSSVIDNGSGRVVDSPV